MFPFYLTIRILVLKNIAAAGFSGDHQRQRFTFRCALGDLSDEIAVFPAEWTLSLNGFRRFEQLPQETEKNLEKKWNKIPFRELEMKQVCFGYSPEKQVLQKH